jgi:transposase-like protein
VLDKKAWTILSSCHEHNEKKRCPQCSSLHTKKKGFYQAVIRTCRGSVTRKLQRFTCLDCNLSFNDRGYNQRARISEDLKFKAVSDYTRTKNSLSEVAERYNVGKSSILKWMTEIADHIPDENVLPEIPHPNGYVMIDGKEIKIGREKYMLLVALDDGYGLPIHHKLYEDENVESTRHFLNGVKKKYPIPVLGMVSDFGKGKCFMKAVKTLFPYVPHQVCVVHFWRYVTLFIPKSRKSIYAEQNMLLKQWIWNVINASSREASLYWLDWIKNNTDEFRSKQHRWFIKSVLFNYRHLTEHFDHPFPKKNNNPVENLNKQLNRKLKNLDNFKSEISAEAFLKLWFLNYFVDKADPI